MMNFYRFLSNIPNSKNVNYSNIKKSFSEKNFEKIQNIKKLPLIGASESHSMPIKLDSKDKVRLPLSSNQK